MTAGVLERDAELRRLRESRRGAGQGRGSAVLVSGEAGIGKTSLVRAFGRETAGRARVLAGQPTVPLVEDVHWAVDRRGGLRYDGGEPLSVVKILEFRGDKVVRETFYFAEPFPAPDWRAPYATDGAPSAAPTSRPGSPAGTEPSGPYRWTWTRAPVVRTWTT